MPLPARDKEQHNVVEDEVLGVYAECAICCPYLTAHVVVVLKC